MNIVASAHRAYSPFNKMEEFALHTAQGEFQPLVSTPST